MITLEQIRDYIQSNLYGINKFLMTSYHKQSFNCEYDEVSGSLSLILDGWRMVRLSIRNNSVECVAIIGAVSENDVFDLLADVGMSPFDVMKVKKSDLIFSRYILPYDNNEAIDHIFCMILGASLSLLKFTDQMRELYVDSEVENTKNSRLPDDFVLIGDGYKMYPLYISKYEVTQELYQSVTGENPSEFIGDRKPVENVSWYDAIRFCNMFSKKDGKTPVYSVNGNTDVNVWNYTAHNDERIVGEIRMNIYADGYRLPTKDEWKFAAAGGENYTYAGSDYIGSVAWYFGNSFNETSKVGQKDANGYGLYDMSGNVWEWCWDEFFVGNEINRYCCGGSWMDDAKWCQIDDDYYFTFQNPHNRDSCRGFRVVCSK